ncbi:glutamine synthetase, putative [Trypanosoma brucei gambiense DAL972]|uniref:glutamine synthetase n=1 Tax=Trypanosoma brucei gambiense (strain MHOM/CI/86/DAL972) TaxID=679716 RepID=C9ZTD4_TRYB9|nr:glutamine synthetase, putative [Trypanosoma brucei gambiense DAL972]CBH12669.1 glutamine synthetase, putative [Trypanosoma brucei gambiense DAL972]|eukprot:XP_011774949.1 glutamine synthetase, putative [Trypanosoma brucei gambiense DAL972]
MLSGITFEIFLFNFEIYHDFSSPLLFSLAIRTLIACGIPSMTNSSVQQVGCRVTYIWLSGKDSHHDIRSKDRTIYISPDDLEKDPKELLRLDMFPVWNFDGSSTGQAEGLITEIHIKPVNAYHCCIPRASSSVPWIVVLAECFLPTGEPTPDNSRAVARRIFDKGLGTHPWFGMEQEYFLVKDGHPYGWCPTCPPASQGPYYCATGSECIRGRKHVDLHYEVCLQMGLEICGTNAEVAFGQWEFQVGPCEGIEMGDQLVVARWVLLRILELEGLDADFRAKPILGDWNGSGLHTNFSTEATRAPGGLEVIYQYIERLKETSSKDIIFYGVDNNERLIGKHETSKLNETTFGIGTRGTSIRIPTAVAAAQSGYMEDRRPAAGADPYLVSSRLFASCLSVDAVELDFSSPRHEREWMASTSKV